MKHAHTHTHINNNGYLECITHTGPKHLVTYIFFKCTCIYVSKIQCMQNTHKALTTQICTMDSADKMRLAPKVCLAPNLSPRGPSTIYRAKHISLCKFAKMTITCFMTLPELQHCLHYDTARITKLPALWHCQNYITCFMTLPELQHVNITCIMTLP